MHRLLEQGDGGGVLSLHDGLEEGQVAEAVVSVGIGAVLRPIPRERGGATEVAQWCIRE